MRTITIPAVNVPVEPADPNAGFPRKDLLSGLKYKVLTDKKPLRNLILAGSIFIIGFVATLVFNSIGLTDTHANIASFVTIGIMTFGSVFTLISIMGGTREPTTQFNLGLFQDWAQQRYNAEINKDPKIIEALHENKSITATLADGTPVLLVVHNSTAKLYRLEGGELPVKETMFAA